MIMNEQILLDDKHLHKNSFTNDYTETHSACVSCLNEMNVTTYVRMVSWKISKRSYFMNECHMNTKSSAKICFA